MAREELTPTLAASASFGELLRQHRLAAGLTQESLAEGAGLSVHGIQKLESGATHPYRDTAERLVRALQLGDHDAALFKMAARPAPRRLQPHGPLTSISDSTQAITTPTNLPISATTFVARAGEIEKVKQRVRESRLLTLSGPGGCGKTRLALEVAGQLQNDFSDGVWLVELAPLTDAALVAQTIATTVGIADEPGRPVLAVLTEYLRSRHALLMLDNCEHLIDTCALVVNALLRSCARVQLLATSRELLGVDGEATWRVASLSVVDPRNVAGNSIDLAEQVLATESGRLFLDRARLVAPSFGITAQNAPAVAEICQRLDGIPLAIELAAARLSMLSVEQIASRLDQRFRLLTGGNRTAVRRQQTLQATIDWSYQLLSEEERRLVRSLAVFAGGWCLEAAEAVCTDPLRLQEDVFELLSRLVAKSMVLVEEPGDNELGVVHYRFLETIRQYADEKLLEAGEAEAVRTRHRDWYLGLAERALRGMEGADQEQWWDRLDLEHGNLRASLTWSAASPNGSDTLLHLAGLLGGFWQARTYISEGIAWLDMALAQCATTPSGARARALNWLGMFEYWSGNAARAHTLLEESVAQARAVRDLRVLSLALNQLGLTMLSGGDPSKAASLFEEALGASREAGYQPQIAWSLTLLAEVLLNAGQLEAVEPLLLEGIAVGRQSGDVRPMLTLFRVLARLHWMRGDVARARRTVQEALELADYRLAAPGRLTWSLPITFLLCMLGNLALAEQDWDAAEDWYHQALSMVSRGTGRVSNVALTLRGFAVVCAARGDTRRAVRIFGATGAMQDYREPVKNMPIDLRSAVSDSIAAARRTLGEDAFAAAWADGQSITIEQAITEILSGEPQQVHS